MLKILKLILLLLYVYFNGLSFAENYDDKNILLQRLTVKDGLSQGTINDIFQDKEGFLWFATENGVNLYDGYRFRVLPGLTESFTNNGVYKIIQDKQSILWMIAADGLISYNKKTNEYQHVLKHAPEHKDFYLVDLLEDEDSTLWIASSKTLLKYVQPTQEYETVVDLSKELLGNDRIYQLEKHGHYLYLATRAGIFLVDTNDGQWKKLPSINDNKLIKNSKLDKVYNIYISNDNQLYIGTFEGLYKLDVNNIETFFTSDSLISNYELLDDNLGSYSFYPSKDSLYIGSALGLSKINLASDKVEHLFAYADVYDSINNNNIINAIQIDSQGMFWLGSDTTGIYKWDPELSMVKTIRYKKSNPNRLSDNLIWALELSKTDPNLLWIGTQNGLNQLDLTTNKVERFLVNTNRNEIYSESFIYSIKEDKAHRLWLYTEKGIKLFDTKTKQKLPLPFSDETNKFLSSNIYGIYLDENDFLWVLTDKKFRRINITTGEIDELIEFEAIKPEISGIHGFLPDSQDMLISSNRRFFSFNPITREMNTLYEDQGVLDNEFAYIDSWLIDKNNILWLAFTTKGLIGLDATTYEKKYFFNKSNAQIDNNIYGLMQDAEGDLWFSSHNGIYSLDIETHYLRNYNVNDGLSAREFNSGAFEKINDSILAYGSVNGLNMFNPSDFKKKKFEGDLIVHATNIDVLSREVKLPFILNPQEKIQFNYDDVGIRFDFSALTFRQDDLVYRYELSGGRNIIYPETTNNSITFANLPSGENTLTVQVRSLETGKYSEKTKLNIYVDYAPWASPLAYIFYFLLILTVFIVWLERKKKITQQLVEAHEQVKSREQRLSLALHGSNSAVWDWQANNNMLFGQRAAEELGYKYLTESYSFDQHIELIHEQDREAFLHQWTTFLAMADLNDNFSCSYRLRTVDGEWLWYKDLGKIVDVDIEGRPIRVTGSYTNITQTRADAERAQYYGEAFKQTKDWVLIISDNFTRIMVNDSLKEAFGWQDQEFSFDADLFGLDEKRMAFYQKLFKSLNEDDHWRGEELIKAKSGEEYHVLLNINVSMNKTTNTLHYVCIFTDITAQKVAEKELRYLANYDHLTDLPNRTLLLERIKHGMDYSKRVNKSIALFFIDLDRFKQVNDSLGHDYGDLLLKQITSRLKKVLRVDDTVARLGGDEFVILLESFKNNSHLGKIAQKIIEFVGQPIDLNGHKVSVGASIGIALYPEDASNSDELLKNADVAMYHAKQIGRNTFQFFTPRMNVEANQRLNAESNIKNAHEQNKFINHYQPIVDSITGKAKGVELLMRWQDEDRLIMPGEFISIAEEIGLIIPMTERAFERALIDLQVWRQYRPDFFLSINISALHFSKDYLVSYLTQTLEKFDVPPSLLKLEVTESTLIKDPDTVITRMKELSKLGIDLALDDFGTGYSSLIYLKKLPLNVLKIDRSFIKGISKDTADEAIVDATLVLAKNLGMKCIAEGVETKEQLTYLAQRDCFAIQGYLYSKPVDYQMITEFLRNDTVELTV